MYIFLQTLKNKFLFMHLKQAPKEFCRICDRPMQPHDTAYGKAWYICPKCNFLQARLTKRIINILNKGEGFEAGTGKGGGGFREYWISELLHNELHLDQILLYGTGNTLTFAQLYEQGKNIWACDISEDLITLRQRNYGERFFHAKHFPPIQFDAIIAVEVFEHLINPAETIDLFVTHLTKDGIIAGTTDLFDNSNISNHFYLLPPLHISYWSEKCFRMAAESIGRLAAFFELECPGSIYPDENFQLLWPRKRVFFLYPPKYAAYFQDLSHRSPVLPINKP
jgi:hypothetical protein